MVSAGIFRSFKTKITLSILGVGLGVAVVVLVIIYWIGRSSLQDIIGSQYRELAFETGQKLQFIIRHNIKEAELLALSSDIRTGVEQANGAYRQRRMTEATFRDRIEMLEAMWHRSKGTDDPFVRDFLNNPASDYMKGFLRDPVERAQHLSMIITDERGILVSADAKPSHVYYADELWWQAAFNEGLGSVYISDVEVAQEATQAFERVYILTIAVPVRNVEGEHAIGVIKTDLQIKPFFDAVTKVHIGRSDHSMLASSDGSLIFCPIFQIRNHTLLPELMQAIFKEGPGWTTTKVDVHYPGRSSINGFAPINFGPGIHPSSFGGKQWYIFTSQNPVETYAPINQLLYGIILTALLGAFLLVVLSRRAAEYIVRPLRELQRGAKLIGFGNLGQRLKIQTGDEIQDLADEFNEMAIKLQASYTNLEQKVADRTQELAVINRITMAISSSLDIKQILDSFSDEVGKLLRYDQISLALLDEDLQKIRFRWIKTKDQPVVIHDTPRPKFGTAVGWVVDHQKPLIQADAAEQSDFVEDPLILRAGMRSYIIVPIIAQHKALGTLILGSTRPSAFSEKNLEILVPVSEQLAIALETIRLFEKTKKLDQLKSDFVSKVSHELRTPLTSIRGFTEILLSYKDVDAKTQQDFITIIHDESERLTRLINDILDLSKIEAGRMEWRIEPIVMSDIITHTVKSVRAIAMEKRLPIETNVPETLPKIQGDRDTLIQLLDNLLSNAIKFTAQGKITVEGVRENSMVRISVADTGIGIPVEETDMIFNKFHQVGDSRDDKPAGTGLGLAICREIIQHLGGRIWCESIPGKGSTFHFTLPVWSREYPHPTPGLKTEPVSASPESRNDPDPDP